MSHIKTPWKTQSLALSLANQLRVLASRAHTSGSLDKIQETCAQGLQVHSNLVHACHFYQRDQPTNFYASPNAALCGLTLHSWRHTATASPRTLARQARARTAGALFKIQHRLCKGSSCAVALVLKKAVSPCRRVPSALEASRIPLGLP